jgi:ribonucleoside-diphosphate reductase beta chain
MSSEQKIDILKDNSDRFVLFPIQHPDVWKMYKDMEAAQWNAQEINIEQDVKDFNQMNDDVQHFIKSVLAFFAASDGIVAENLALKFYGDVQVPEIRCFYGLQIANEQVHAETYSILIDSYIKDEMEKNKLFKAMHLLPAITKKAEWAVKWINSSESFAERLFAFAIVEGVFFSSSFCAIFWLKYKYPGKMQGLSQSNQLISRDEGYHTDFACLIYNKKLNNKLPQTRVYEILEDAVAIEKEFVTSALPVEMLGMNSKHMCSYIEYVADRLLAQLNYDKIYNTKLPFDFMDQLSMEGKSNFFELMPTEYKKAIHIKPDFDTSSDF